MKIEMKHTCVNAVRVSAVRIEKKRRKEKNVKPYGRERIRVEEPFLRQTAAAAVNVYDPSQ